MLHRFAHNAMGTRFELVLEADDAHSARPIAEEVFEEVQEWHDRLSVFSPASEVTRINTLASAQPVRISADLFELLTDCRRLWERTRGAFDITVAPAMAANGLRGGDVGSGATPIIGCEHLLLDPTRTTVRFEHPGMAIDLGAIGKGHAIARAGEVLRDLGVRRAFLHGGTSTGLAIGAPPDATGWQVRIASDAPEPLELALRDTTFSVSAPSGRVAISPQGRHTHILDPVSGDSIGTGACACIVGRCAREADAWSTALLVLGERPGTLAASVVSAISTDAGPWQIQGDFSSCIPHQALHPEPAHDPA